MNTYAIYRTRQILNFEYLILHTGTWIENHSPPAGDTLTSVVAAAVAAPSAGIEQRRRTTRHGSCQMTTTLATVRSSPASWSSSGSRRRHQQHNAVLLPEQKSLRSTSLGSHTIICSQKLPNFLDASISCMYTYSR